MMPGDLLGTNVAANPRPEHGPPKVSGWRGCIGGHIAGLQEGVNHEH